MFKENQQQEWHEDSGQYFGSGQHYTEIELPKARVDMDIHQISCIDDYRDNDFEMISQLVDERMAEGFHGDPTVDLSRKRKSTMDLTNPSTKWMYDNLPGFAEWHSTIPTATALGPLYNPNAERYATGEVPTPEIRVWQRNLYDAIGIRSRAKVMEELVVSEVMNADSGRQQAWASLACGAAQPVFSALSKIQERGGITPNVVLADYDPRALSLAKRAATEAGLSGNVETKRMNILKTQGIAYRHEARMGILTNALGSIGKLPAESFDMVDAVGLLEYLKPDDWAYEYRKVIKSDNTMAGAVTFLKNAYELVRPGGVLIVGNMRETHPQLGFTLNVIQWPHIQPRSLEQMQDIFDQAELNGKIDAYCPDDNVYAIYVIRKDR